MLLFILKTGTLFIWPKFGNMLGGQEVNITGPCFGEHPVKDSDYFVPYENTFCKWGDGPDAPITRAEVITILRARCVVPLMFFTGRINLYVTTNNKISYEWKAEFTIGKFHIKRKICFKLFFLIVEILS